MIFFAIVIGVALTFIIAFSLYLSADEGSFGEGLICGVFIILLSIAEILTIYIISEEPEPKAIDVYRNKTELEITSVNGVPRDTIVVWKGGKQ
jgi:hypothetical protein